MVGAAHLWSARSCILSWRAFYLRWAEVFRVLDRPFKWALLVGGLVLLAFVVGLLI